ncbi:hypothetical protein BH23PAT2_BH23PAT2_08300 [soil metagenome]
MTPKPQANKSIENILARLAWNGKYADAGQEVVSAGAVAEATRAITQAMLDAVGEDETQIIDDSGLDGKFCATCDCTLEGDFDFMECRCQVRNDLRAEIRTAIKKMGENYDQKPN